jgi:hypothetical protein
MKVPPTTRLLLTDDSPHSATIPVKQVEQDAVHGYSEVIDLHFAEVVGVDLLSRPKKTWLSSSIILHVVIGYCISENKSIVFIMLSYLVYL